MATESNLADRGMAVGLRALNWLAASDLLDRVGLREPTERFLHGASRTSARSAARAGRTFAAAQKRSRPARQPAAGRWRNRCGSVSFPLSRLTTRLGGGMDALNHLPFVEALATSDDATDDWRRTAAGWVTVRLVDRWLAEGQRAVAANDQGVGALWTALEAVSPSESTDKEREALAKVVSAMQRAERPQASAVRDALFGYGRALQDRLAWGPASDVFRMVMAQASGDGQSTAPADPELVDKATLRLGGCLRQLGDAQAAGQCYSLVRSRAEARKDSVRAIWARLGEARLIADRGFRARFVRLEAPHPVPQRPRVVLAQILHVAYFEPRAFRG